ncbi:PREDICTED: palmitoyltransferase ERF2-like [Priapulus caudatus]|uniref:Palmitoyltransferase n=1 Tax=Priapulus caudatus TaxID=37621 RepID=A0ABM1F1Y4_PRICU|nr:PREDICTED: palmitoyltransferase ERF2-like [Priapulus caudatus]
MLRPRVVFGISPLLDGLCIMGIIIMIPTFSVLLWRDPGTVREARRRPLAAAAAGVDAGDGCRGDEEDATSPYMTIRDVARGAVPQEGFCGFCEIVMPDRTKHCRLCESCMHTMDHHCLFLTKCVARSNHRLFLSFVFVLAVAMAMFLANVVVYVNATYGELGTAAAIARATLRDALVLAAATLNAATLVWCIALLKYQVALVCVDRTTVQNLMFASPARARGAPCRRFSTREKLVNLIAFCLGRDIGAADGGAPKLLV